MSLTIFQNEKTLFQAIKTRSSKSGKIAILPKGLAHGFGQKLSIVPSFFFQAVQARKMSFTIFQNEKTPFQAIKTKSLKSGKIAIVPNGLVHGFGQKLAIFPSFFFSNIGQENVFYHILERKNVFLSYKKRKLKKWKNCYFSKGVSPWFWSKIGHFSIFCLKAIQARKMSFTILSNEKTSFQVIKTRSSKSGKIAIFPKGLVHGFVKNWPFFHLFFKAI